MSNWDECLKQFPQIPQDVEKALYKIIEKKLQTQLVTVESDIELTCFTREGVGVTKRALKAGLALSTKASKLSIKLVGGPLFKISVSTPYPEQGKKLVTKVVPEICDKMKQSGGDCVIKTQAHATTQMNDCNVQQLAAHDHSPRLQYPESDTDVLLPSCTVPI